VEIMKISQFANRFGLGINTVRYYVNAGLIVPEKRNGQNIFNEQNLEEMELVLMLKRCGFSIDQIHKTISLTRISNLTTKDDIQDYLAILHEQQDYLMLRSEQLQQSIDDLGKYIDEIQKRGDDVILQSSKCGVPIEFMPYLCCPHCDRSLNFKDTTIINTQIIKAQAICECGYGFKIENGILITEGGFISEYDFPDLDRKFYKDLPASWITLFQKSYNWMYAQWKDMKLKGKIVLENHINCYFFLYTVLNRLDKDVLYIISDKYREIVELYKSLIEIQNPELKILYIADSTLNYPLRKECVDLFVDYCAINEHAIFDSEDDLIGLMLPFMKKEAHVLGTYFYFDNNSPSYHKLLEEYPPCRPHNYLLSFYKHLVRRYSMKLIKEELDGYVTDACGANRNFSFHVAGDRMSLLSYQWAQSSDTPR